MKSKRLLAESELPLLVEPGGAAEAPAERLGRWLREERPWVEEHVRRHGGLLLRGFDVGGAAQFGEVCRAMGSELMAYTGGESPRSRVAGEVYTSTEYPAHLEISLHNEMSYAREWPRWLFFFCLRPASSGGETHLADGRTLLARIAPEVHERFALRGVRYLRNLPERRGVGKSWQETFETTDRSRVEEHCRRAGIHFRWSASGLFTRADRPAVVAHPETGERVWFNQAEQWHVSSRGPEAERALRRVFGESELPRHACHADGSPIAAADLEEIRRAQREVEVLFPWRAGDVLVLDNVLVAHGRKPYRGPREVFVATA